VQTTARVSTISTSPWSTEAASVLASGEIVAVFAQLRVDTIRGNTIRGLAHARSIGRVGVRPTVVTPAPIDTAVTVACGRQEHGPHRRGARRRSVLGRARSRRIDAENRVDHADSSRRRA
jgi:hypothetical protein